MYHNSQFHVSGNREVAHAEQLDIETGGVTAIINIVRIVLSL